MVTLGFPFQNEHDMLVTIETYALNQTWSEQDLRRLSLAHNPVLGIQTRVHCRFHVFTMACPFDERPVDIGAQIIRAIHRERLIRPRLDILSFLDYFLLERYSFSRDSFAFSNPTLPMLPIVDLPSVHYKQFA